MSWEAIQNAVQEQIAFAGSLDPAKVIWKYQNADQPPVPFVEISIDSIATVGQDYVETTYDATRTAGQEIKQQVKGDREVGLMIECYTADIVGRSAAVFLGELIRTSLLLPAVRSQLLAAGVAPFDPGPVQWLPAIVQVGFRGRATCLVRCYMNAQDVIEYTTYISRVSGTVVISGGLNPPTVTLPFDTGDHE